MNTYTSESAVVLKEDDRIVVEFDKNDWAMGTVVKVVPTGFKIKFDYGEQKLLRHGEDRIFRVAEQAKHKEPLTFAQAQKFAQKDPEAAARHRAQIVLNNWAAGHDFKSKFTGNEETGCWTLRTVGFSIAIYLTERVKLYAFVPGAKPEEGKDDIECGKADITYAEFDGKFLTSFLKESDLVRVQKGLPGRSTGLGLRAPEYHHEPVKPKPVPKPPKVVMRPRLQYTGDPLLDEGIKQAAKEAREASKLLHDMVEALKLPGGDGAKYFVGKYYWKRVGGFVPRLAVMYDMLGQHVMGFRKTTKYPGHMPAASARSDTVVYANPTHILSIYEHVATNADRNAYSVVLRVKPTE